MKSIQPYKIQSFTKVFFYSKEDTFCPPWDPKRGDPWNTYYGKQTGAP